MDFDDCTLRYTKVACCLLSPVHAKSVTCAFFLLLHRTVWTLESRRVTCVDLFSRRSATAQWAQRWRCSQYIGMGLFVRTSLWLCQVELLADQGQDLWWEVDDTALKHFNFDDNEDPNRPTVATRKSKSDSWAALKAVQVRPYGLVLLLSHSHVDGFCLPSTAVLSPRTELVPCAYS